MVWGCGLGTRKERVCITYVHTHTWSLDIRATEHQLVCFELLVWARDAVLQSVISEVLHVCVEKRNTSQSMGIKADAVGCGCRGGNTLRILDDRISRDNVSLLKSSHASLSIEVFVLGSQILTRHHSVPWKSSWHIVRMVVLLPAKEERKDRAVNPFRKPGSDMLDFWDSQIASVQHLVDHTDRRDHITWRESNKTQRMWSKQPIHTI